MKNLIIRVFNRYFSFRRVGKLSVGREVEFINKGKIQSGLSYMGGIRNLTVNLVNANSSKSFLLNEGEVILGDNVRIHKGFGIHVGKGAVFSLGDNSYINPESIIICHSSITIGKDCAISWKVELIDDDLHTIYDTDDKVLNPSRQIVIGNKVWIGAGAKILKGSVIGDGAIIAAGSIVTGVVDSNSLYAGIPAKKIKENVNWK